MVKKTRAALVPSLALAAALIFSLSGCGGNTDDASGLDKYGTADKETKGTDSAAQDGGIQSDDNEAGSLSTDMQSDDNDTEDEYDPTQHRMDFMLESGVRFLAETDIYTQDDAEQLFESANEVADSFCDAAFNYDADDTMITARIDAMIAKIGDLYFDKAENFNTVYTATNAELSYYWYDPSYVYTAHDDTYGDIVCIMGIARIHMKSDWIQDNDYDATVYVKTVQVDGKWKIHDVSCGDLYLPGEVNVHPDESYKWIIDVDGTPAASFDIYDVEGYLTHYSYSLGSDEG